MVTIACLIVTTPYPYALRRIAVLLPAMLPHAVSRLRTERLAYGALLDGRWRKHTKALRDRLAVAQQRVASSLLDLGFELFVEPKAGMLQWARHPAIENSSELAYKAAEQDILLGPGHLFMLDLQPSPWLRFNVAHCQDETVFAFLRSQTAG